MKFDTFIIGCQKAGTTYLHDLLSQHPDIKSHYGGEFASFLEPHYTNEITIQKNLKERIIESELTEKKHLLGKSVGLFVSKSGLDNLLSHNESIKLIIVLRNPIDRVFSAYNYCYSRGIEKNKSFSVAIRERNRYPNDIMRNRNCNYIDGSMYSLHLDRIVEIVQKERIMIINFEDLINNPKQICIDVFKFIGLPHKNILINTNKIMNLGVNTRFPKLNSIFLLKNSWINKIWKKFPPKYRSKALTYFLKLNTKTKINRESISDSDKSYLKQIFKEDLENLKIKYNIKFNL